LWVLHIPLCIVRFSEAMKFWVNWQTRPLDPAAQSRCVKESVSREVIKYWFAQLIKKVTFVYAYTVEKNTLYVFVYVRQEVVVKCLLSVWATLGHDNISLEDNTGVKLTNEPLLSPLTHIHTPIHRWWDSLVRQQPDGNLAWVTSWKSDPLVNGVAKETRECERSIAAEDEWEKVGDAERETHLNKTRRRIEIKGEELSVM